MAQSTMILNVRRQAGVVEVVFYGKRGRRYGSVEELQEIMDQAREVIDDELLFALAVRQVGVANATTLAGKTITLNLSVSIT